MLLGRVAIRATGCFRAALHCGPGGRLSPPLTPIARNPGEHPPPRQGSGQATFAASSRPSALAKPRLCRTVPSTAVVLDGAPPLQFWASPPSAEKRWSRFAEGGITTSESLETHRRRCRLPQTIADRHHRHDRKREMHVLLMREATSPICRCEPRRPLSRALPALTHAVVETP